MLYCNFRDAGVYATTRKDSQVLQAALATMLLHHKDRAALLRTFQGYMKISKESTPQLARHMAALEGGMLALLGQGTEPEQQ